MTENFTIASFLVIFFDGEHEIDLDNVNVLLSLEFKNFRSFLSQKIRIPPQQIAISLIRRKPSRSSPRNCHRISITDTGNQIRSKLTGTGNLPSDARILLEK
uniref:DUF7138 domain-containing protein n=1 Tax=Nelumbo nucifera TaxID=4432 RepID=A0A822YS50_NELNU|nr:TPA_asm: hypothetical protein HUJ06_006122 [Nelumbo nucifera]